MSACLISVVSRERQLDQRRLATTTIAPGRRGLFDGRSPTRGGDGVASVCLISVVSRERRLDQRRLATTTITPRSSAPPDDVANVANVAVDPGMSA